MCVVAHTTKFPCLSHMHTCTHTQVCTSKTHNEIMLHCKNMKKSGNTSYDKIQGLWIIYTALERKRHYTHFCEQAGASYKISCSTLISTTRNPRISFFLFKTANPLSGNVFFFLFLLFIPTSHSWSEFCPIVPHIIFNSRFMYWTRKNSFLV